MHCLLGQRIVSLIRSQCSSPSIVGVQAVLVSICALHKSCETFYCFLVWGKLQKPMCKLSFFFSNTRISCPTLASFICLHISLCAYQMHLSCSLERRPACPMYQGGGRGAPLHNLCQGSPVLSMKII